METLPFEDVFIVRTQLQAAEGTWHNADSLPASSLFPIFGIISGGDMGEGITKFFSVLVYDSGSYLTRYIDTDGAGGFLGYQRSLSGSEAIIQWKQLLTPLSGIGLKGEYYGNISLSGALFATRYENIDFDWNVTPPPGLSGMNFSVRWDGQLQVATTGDYRFRTISDDGVRLWVDDILIIDNWATHGTTTNTSTITTLVAGFVNVRLEYFQGTEGGEIHLLWAIPPFASLFNVITKDLLYNPGYA